MPIVGAIDARFHDDGSNVTLLSTAYYVDPGGRAWPAYAGLLSDGLSVPRAAWSLVTAPFNGRARLMAFFHDQAYRTPGASKEDADRMLLEGMAELGAPQAEADAIYEAVLLLGRAAFDSDQRQYADGGPGSGWGEERDRRALLAGQGPKGEA